MEVGEQCGVRVAIGKVTEMARHSCRNADREWRAKIDLGPATTLSSENAACSQRPIGRGNRGRAELKRASQLAYCRQHGASRNSATVKTLFNTRSDFTCISSSNWIL